MLEILSHVGLAFLVSYIGSLPFGVLNLTTVDIAIHKGMLKAFWFALAVVLVESIQAFIALFFSGFLTENPQIEAGIEIAIIPIMFFIGVYYFRKKPNKEKHADDFSSFGKGIILSILNPLAIPFWFFWGTIFTVQKLLIPSLFYILCFVLGVVVGSLCALMTYAYIGKLIATRLQLINKWIDKIIGVILMGLALAQLIRLVVQGL